MTLWLEKNMIEYSEAGMRKHQFLKYECLCFITLTAIQQSLRSRTTPQIQPLSYIYKRPPPLLLYSEPEPEACNAPFIKISMVPDAQCPSAASSFAFCDTGHAHPACPHNPSSQKLGQRLSVAINILALAATLGNHPDPAFAQFLNKGFKKVSTLEFPYNHPSLMNKWMPSQLLRSLWNLPHNSHTWGHEWSRKPILIIRPRSRRDNQQRTLQSPIHHAIHVPPKCRQ